MTADRLALATRTRKARRTSTCTICRVPIIVGQPIARLIRPAGWCHVRCVPVVAAIKTSAAEVAADAPSTKEISMTMTTPGATAQRVHVRRHGYGELQKIHRDHSATVRLDDGTEQHVPFGDWVYAATHPQYENKGASGVKKFIADALRRDLGEDFTVTDEIHDPGAAISFLASYGPDYLVEVKVTPRGGF